MVDAIYSYIDENFPHLRCERIGVVNHWRRLYVGKEVNDLTLYKHVGLISVTNNIIQITPCQDFVNNFTSLKQDFPSLISIGGEVVLNIDNPDSIDCLNSILNHIEYYYDNSKAVGTKRHGTSRNPSVSSV